MGDKRDPKGEDLRVVKKYPRKGLARVWKGISSPWFSDFLKKCKGAS